LSKGLRSCKRMHPQSLRSLQRRKRPFACSTGGDLALPQALDGKGPAPEFDARGPLAPFVCLFDISNGSGKLASSPDRSIAVRPASRQCSGLQARHVRLAGLHDNGRATPVPR
jgi:hypothetical protein